MTSLAANGRAGSAEDEKSVFNLCFAELSFSHARKIMNVGINKRKGRGACWHVVAWVWVSHALRAPVTVSRETELESLSFSCQPCMCV